jgi:hypothetical protein
MSLALVSTDGSKTYDIWSSHTGARVDLPSGLLGCEVGYLRRFEIL